MYHRPARSSRPEDQLFQLCRQLGGLNDAVALCLGDQRADSGHCLLIAGGSAFRICVLRVCHQCSSSFVRSHGAAGENRASNSLYTTRHGLATCFPCFFYENMQKAAEAAGACQKVLLTRSQTENAAPVFRLKILRAAARRICLQTAHKFCTCGTGRFARRSRRRAKPIGILVRARGCRCCQAGACVLRSP